jgi:hypothetical protein
MAEMVWVMTMKKIVPEIIGRVTLRKRRTAPAPSSTAAS